MSKTIEITNNNFKDEVLNSKIPILVDFWAPWCQPCRAIAPFLEDLLEKLEGKLKIGKLNIEIPENQEFAMQYQVQSIPNMKLFNDGKVIRTFAGSYPREMLKEELSKEINHHYNLRDY